uniref:Metalloendopeptidase n=1 Tax=Parastrongyloides trichosuri TaxID=131310 RepID=A0A0N4ZCQ6_PARTI
MTPRCNTLFQLLRPFNTSYVRRYRRDVEKAHGYQWTSPIKYLTITLPHKKQKYIGFALEKISNRTCLSFSKITKIKISPNLYLLHDSPCISIFGRFNELHSKHSVSFINIKCDDIGSIHQELGLIFGLPLEHTRNDRDSYVTIRQENVIESKIVDFQKSEGNDSMDVPYDYGSQMHYGKNSFAKEQTNSIEPADINYLNTIGHNFGFQFNDYKRLNSYHCHYMCNSHLEKGCERNGYVDRATCDKCICPPHFSGTYCDKYKKTKSDCGENVVFNATTEAQTFTIKGEKKCYFYINTDENSKIELTIINMNIGNEEKCLVDEYLEVRYKKDPSVMGALFCKDKNNVLMTSEGNDISIFYKSSFSGNNVELSFKKV